MIDELDAMAARLRDLSEALARDPDCEWGTRREVFAAYLAITEAKRRLQGKERHARQ